MSKQRLTRGIADCASEGTHPRRRRVNDLGVGEDVRQRDAADEEARREKVPKVERSGRVVGREVVGAGAAAAEPVWEGRERKQEGFVLAKEGQEEVSPVDRGREWAE